jgi:hypothetical protein
MASIHHDSRQHRTTLTGEELDLTTHAQERMALRGIRPGDIETVLLCGREVHASGAVIHVIGRKEVEQYRRFGSDLAPLEGLHVVIALDGAIVTAYRNRSTLMVKERRRVRGWRPEWRMAA